MVQFQIVYICKIHYSSFHIPAQGNSSDQLYLVL